MSNNSISSLIRSMTKSSISTAQTLSAPVPGLENIAQVLDLIIQLCERVPQNKNAARQLANRCKGMYQLLEQYQTADLPDRVLKYREDIFDCLKYVESKMNIWANTKWLSMLIHQDEFSSDINECTDRIGLCFNALMTATNFETLAWKKETENWRRDFAESVNNDHTEISKSLASGNLVQQATASQVTKNRNDIRKLLELMQNHLSKGATEMDDRERMASNLYDLLRLSHQLLPRLQLDSGEVEWMDKKPLQRWKDVTIYKGRYLKREDVMIKAILSVKKDGENVIRIRREVETWAKVYEADQGKHILPFYGFCTSDGIHLALVSPWIKHGDALSYVKKNDRSINYRNLIRGIAEGIAVLHSMDEPIVHGQLRAEKIYIGDEGQPLLTDFALSKLEGNAITQTAGISEAYRWSAPEAEITTETGVASTRNDVYSFGMTILELLTHARPYANVSKNVHVIKRVERGEPPDRPADVPVVERGLDDDMWKLLLWCWSYEPEQRPSINDILGRL